MKKKTNKFEIPSFNNSQAVIIYNLFIFYRVNYQILIV
jgi:hypothetical protein